MLSVSIIGIASYALATAGTTHGVDERGDRAAVHHARRLVELGPVRQPHAAVVEADLLDLQPDELREQRLAPTARSCASSATRSGASGSNDSGSGASTSAIRRRSHRESEGPSCRVTHRPVVQDRQRR